jgi:NuA3 HAT complex component NTO1
MHTRSLISFQACLFCPNEGGAFKQTTTGHWSHLLCAIWIPELQMGNPIYMEPVEGVKYVPKNRWKLVGSSAIFDDQHQCSRGSANCHIQVCSLCKLRTGACIQCDNRNCFTAFHVTCARQTGQLMSMKSLGANSSLVAYCEKHLPVGLPLNQRWRKELTI